MLETSLITSTLLNKQNLGGSVTSYDQQKQGGLLSSKLMDLGVLMMVALAELNPRAELKS